MGISRDFLGSEILDKLKFGAVDTTNNVFKLFANISPAIFWLASTIVIASSYIGSPIKCMKDDEFILATCWIHGTYHVDEAINKDVNSGRLCRRSYDATDYDYLTTDEREADTPYYQWVPFMLFIHGLIFLISANIWNFYENGLLQQFGTRSNISTLIEEEEIRKVAEQNARKFKALSRKRNNRYFAVYIMCEVGNILAVIFNFYFIDAFLGGRFKSYGSDVVAHAMNKNPNDEDTMRNEPMCSAFPTLTNCKIKFGGVVKGSADEISTLCILSQNIINQKLYLGIWFWLIILLIACLLNTIYRIAIILVPALRKQELVGLINTKRRKEEFLDKDNIVREQWEETGKIGNWFVLSQIGRNSNSYYFRQFLQSLIDNDRSRGNNVPSNNEPGMRNINVEEGLGTGTKKALLGAD